MVSAESRRWVARLAAGAVGSVAIGLLAVSPSAADPTFTGSPDQGEEWPAGVTSYRIDYGDTLTLTVEFTALDSQPNVHRMNMTIDTDGDLVRDFFIQGTDPGFGSESHLATVTQHPADAGQPTVDLTNSADCQGGVIKSTNASLSISVPKACIGSPDKITVAPSYSVRYVQGGAGLTFAPFPVSENPEDNLYYLPDGAPVVTAPKAEEPEPETPEPVVSASTLSITAGEADDEGVVTGEFAVEAQEDEATADQVTTLAAEDEAVPTGSVSWTLTDETDKQLGAATKATLADGKATFTTDELAAGTYTLAAEYSGDDNFEASSAETTLTIAADDTTNTTTTDGTTTTPTSTTTTTTPTGSGTVTTAGTTPTSSSSLPSTGLDAELALAILGALVVAMGGTFLWNSRIAQRIANELD